MNVLLHICCGPCGTYSIEHMRDELGHGVTGFFYNPNIHPYMEFKARLEATRRMAELYDIELLVDDAYELEEFMRRIVNNIDERCPVCYRMRLERTAERAAADGFDAFSTTLLISPYQQRAVICDIGEALADKHGVSFIAPELDKGFRQAQHRARELGLYRQKYCGCVFSEKERYLKKK